jgi:lysyl-tRNA synthetase class 2
MKKAAQFRSQLNRSIRTFFDQKLYLEVETPTLSPDLIPEPTIENFATRFDNEFVGSKELYLIPSPEIYMKRLIAEGFGNIYQIGHCFRNSEQIGRHHNPEFSMLEYYSVGMDEQDSIDLTEELFAYLDGPSFLKPPFDRLTVSEAMYQYAQIDLDKNQNQKSLAQEARRLGLSVPDKPESWEDTFNRIFLTLVEPNLPQQRPLVLERYPAQIDCLAKKEGNYRKRWELYAGGIEIANCYDEETDKDIVSAYYRKEYAILIQKRADRGLVIPDADPSFADIFTDFPQCSGVALGLDRLQMLLMGESSLEGVILFPVSGTVSSRK